MKILLLVLLNITVFISEAQKDQPITLNIGDNAPPLKVKKWMKGAPILNFEKGKVYVLEFWATWCMPCLRAMPHLSVLSDKYKDNVIFIAMDVYERKTTSLEKVSAFVDSMGQQMNFHVAAQDSNFMETKWLYAAGELSIPTTYVINQDGKLAWFGHPAHLDEVLPSIANRTWDVTQANANHIEEKRLKKLDKEANEQLNTYEGMPGKPDSALIFISELTRKEPKLKYAPLVSYHTFSALLKTDADKAYEYGKAAFANSTYDDPLYGRFIDVIKSDIGIWHLPDKIYELGAEAYQALIDQYPYDVDIPSYLKMAEWYWKANNKPKAIAAGEKAVEAMKIKSGSLKSF